jgi:hypothetical protein
MPTKYNVIQVSFLAASDRRKLLLVGDRHSVKISLFTAQGAHAASVDLPLGDQLSDVAWTPIRDNIVYTNILNNDACVMSVNGNIIARTNIYSSSRYRPIGVSSDNNIYIALGYNGIVMSTDDGMTWSRLQHALSRLSLPAYAIKVSTANHTADELWVLENHQLTSFNYRLRAYKTDSQSGSIVINSSRDIAQFKPVAYDTGTFKLVYDGDRHVYAVLSENGEKGVSVLSVYGDYVCQLLSPLDVVTPVQSLAVSKQRDYLYLGMNLGYISVYALSYNS